MTRPSSREAAVPTGMRAQEAPADTPRRHDPDTPRTRRVATSFLNKKTAERPRGASGE
jgi:hypothetical protein